MSIGRGTTWLFLGVKFGWCFLLCWVLLVVIVVWYWLFVSDLVFFGTLIVLGGAFNWVVVVGKRYFGLLDAFI